MLRPEIIGDPRCPILKRWTLFGDRRTRDWPIKVMVHHFLPHADDRDVHDHPRSFLTIVVKGGYDDMEACNHCDQGYVPYAAVYREPYERAFGLHTFPAPRAGFLVCPWCQGDTVVLRETMRPGMVRLRRARHAHRTKVHASGCWTIVVMGPRVRSWGFIRGGRWIPWNEYRLRFGASFRCEDDQ